MVVFLSIGGVYLGINMGLSWLFMSRFTSPICPPCDSYLENLPGEIIQIQAQDGRMLPSHYMPPQNGVVVLALGGLCGATGDQLPPVNFLISKGYGVLQLGSRVCALPPAPVTIGGNELNDAQAALDYLDQQDEVKHIAVIGFSMGGATSIRTAARRNEIEAVIAEGGYSNLGEEMAGTGPNDPFYRRFLLYILTFVYRIQSGIDPWQISPISDISLISPRPILLIYGDQEIQNGHGQEQFAAAHAPKQLWIVPGGNHGTNYAVAKQEYEQRVLQFLAAAFPSVKPITVTLKSTWNPHKLGSP